MAEEFITKNKAREYMITKIVKDNDLILNEGIIKSLINTDDVFTLHLLIENRKTEFENILHEEFVKSIKFVNNQVCEILIKMMWEIGLELPESAIMIPSIINYKLKDFFTGKIKSNEANFFKFYKLLTDLNNPVKNLDELTKMLQFQESENIVLGKKTVESLLPYFPQGEFIHNFLRINNIPFNLPTFSADSCLDVLMYQEDTNIDEFLEEDQNIAIYYEWTDSGGNQQQKVYCLNKEVFQEQLNNKINLMQLIVFKCRRNYEEMFSLRYNEDSSKRQIFNPNPYIKLRKFNIQYGGIANLGNFLKVIMNSNEKKFKLVNFTETGHTISYRLVDGNATIHDPDDLQPVVSNTHCQAGSNRPVYGLVSEGFPYLTEEMLDSEGFYEIGMEIVEFERSQGKGYNDVIHLYNDSYMNQNFLYVDH